MDQKPGHRPPGSCLWQIPGASFFLMGPRLSFPCDQMTSGVQRSGGALGLQLTTGSTRCHHEHSVTGPQGLPEAQRKTPKGRIFKGSVLEGLTMQAVKSSIRPQEWGLASLVCPLCRARYLSNKYRSLNIRGSKGEGAAMFYSSINNNFLVTAPRPALSFWGSTGSCPSY